MTGISIYNQHGKAFRNVSAYVVMRAGEKVATIAFRHPRDGAGRLWCYLQCMNARMVRGYAGGYGYDKGTAAVESAARAINLNLEENASETLVAFKSAIANCGGRGWERKLLDAGFDVFRAV